MKSVLRQHKAERRHKKIRRMALMVCIPALLFAGMVAGMLALPQLRVSHITVAGNKSLPAEDILHVAKDSMQDRVFGVFPRSNMFLFRSALLAARIREAFPLVAAAEVSRSWARTIHITVRERAMWGTYCVPAAANCFYIAADGVLTSPAPQLTGGVILRITDVQPPGPPAVGRRALEERRSAHIQHIAAWLRDRYALELREIVLNRNFEGITELHTNEGWYVLIDEKTNIERAIENANLIFDQHIADRAMLEYIDIRFEGKVFYRPKL